jgi:hypothetical protein
MGTLGVPSYYPSVDKKNDPTALDRIKALGARLPHAGIAVFLEFQTARSKCRPDPVLAVRWANLTPIVCLGNVFTGLLQG